MPTGDPGYMKAYREKNRDRLRAAQKAYVQRNREKIKQRNADRPCAPGKPDMWACRMCNEEKPFNSVYFQPKNTNKFKLDTACRKCTNAYSLKNTIRLKYGLTKEQADKIHSSICMICGATERIHIDHCHATGFVRGPLCSSCNNGLGCFKDRPDLLRLAAAYVEQFVKPND